MRANEERIHQHVEVARAHAVLGLARLEELFLAALRTLAGGLAARGDERYQQDGFRFHALEPEGRAERRTAEAEVLQQLVVALVVIELAIGKDQITPLEAVGDAGHALPREVRRAAADIQVVRAVPRRVAPAHPPTHADDAVPEIALPRHAARGGEGLAAARSAHCR